jgi:hypothetical protein
MSYSNKIYEEALNDIKEDNKKLRKDLDRHIQIGAEFSGIINEMLAYIEQKDDKDYLRFVEMVEKALERNR